MVKVYIDPGHGGSDPGAVGNGIEEKSITLQIAIQIRDILLAEYENISVQMSRTGDQTVSLDARTNGANNWNADLFLSVHINSGGGSGFESFVYPGVGRPTVTYQELIHQKVLKQVQFNNRGLKQSSFHVLRESNMDAILTENGFIDHSEDAGKLKSSGFLENLARGHAYGIAEAFGLPKKANVSNQQPSQSSTSENGLFRVQVGAFKDKANAEKVLEETKASGFETYIRQENNLFKVQIGAFSVRNNAEELKERANAVGLNAVIVIE
ncbi:MAG TPA: N-acetylmuramoyl-L-alanine amidase [Bacillus sp. (in: firmicutes)]|nr:N-acetylmuramoyl-L-alanine amidase [Bacillus sp. (in: firmicutes)]